MAYIPDPTDVSQPVGSVIAQTAAAEFRALKAYIATLAGLGGGMNLYRKNKIINGNMVIDQRRAGALASIAVVGPTAITDKWKAGGVAAAGVYSAQQLTATAVTWLGAAKTTKFIVTTIDAAPAAGSTYGFYNGIEGIDCADLMWGTASAKPIALSFLVSAPIGTYSGAIRNSATDRSYPFTYTVLTANTPEYKSIIIPGDVTGTWLNTVGVVGMYVNFNLDCGATAKAPTAASWQAGAFTAVTGSFAFMATLANAFEITNVQVEQASVASPFEWIPFEEQLSLCQRYFEKSCIYGTAVSTALDNNYGLAVISASIASGAFYHRTTYVTRKAKAAPTITIYPYTTPANTGRSSNSTGVDYPANSAAITVTSDQGFTIQNTSGGALAIVSNLVLLNWFSDADF